MCGIAGIIAPSLSSAKIDSTLRRMNDVIMHRGPDDFGRVAEDGRGIGMRRLSIIDLAGGQQPISNETRDIHVVCNGEIYNHVQLRESLLKQGHRFATRSDAEVVVHLYEQYGDECFKHMRGMFGLAIWDTRRNRVIIARDRLGKKPMFYAHRGERFWFGSEMKSLLAVEPSLNAPNYRTLGHFLQFAYIPEPETIYREISRLPAGHYGVIEGNRFESHAYWQISFEPDYSVGEQEWAERLDCELAEAVKVRLMSEVPLGVFLSGGLDSSAIVAYAHETGLHPLKTFTIGFDRPEWDESDDAARVAKHFGTDHHLLKISESDLSGSFHETLHAITHHCDEPFGDASAIPTYHVSRLAREHVTVILSGDGGDELFAGYSSYRGALFAQSYRRWIPHPIGRYALPGLANAAASVFRGNMHYKALRIAKVLRDSALPLKQAYRDKTSIWSVPELKQLLAPECFATADYVGERYMPEPLWERMCGEGDLIGKLTEIDLRSYMLDDILVKVDRMSMAHSLEVRSPLLDHNVVELAARMPSSMKIRGGQGKHIFRKVIRSKLPPKTVNKGKQGFSVPLRDWFRGRLASMVHDTLTCEENLPSSIFAPTKVAKILDQHRRGTADHANKIWLLLTFAAWHSQYQNSDGSSTGPTLGCSRMCAYSTRPGVGTDKPASIVGRST